MSVQNTQYITVGSADLYIDGRNVGSVKEPSFGVARDYLEHVSGIPQRVDKKVLITDATNVKATLEEISPQNLALALGLDSSDITNTVSGKESSNWEKALILYKNNWAFIGRSPIARATGTADSGTTTTLVDDVLSDTDDYYNGWILRIVDGTNAGEERTVTDYDGATHTVTVDSAFSSAIDNTSKYVLTSLRAQVGSVITEAADTGATSIKVRNATNFNPGDSIMIGGNANTVSSISENTITLGSALANAVTADTIVRDISVTLQEDVDYRVDYIDGRIEPLDSGILQDEEDLIVAFDYITYSGQSIPLGKLTSNKEYHVLLRHHLTDGGWLEFEFWKTNVASNFEFGFNTSDWVGMPIEINAVNDETNHPTAPYGEIRMVEE